MASRAELADEPGSIQPAAGSRKSLLFAVLAAFAVRARELACSNAELEQFASITSHDLQESLRKIRMFGDRLATRHGEGMPEEAAADLVMPRDEW